MSNDLLIGVFDPDIVQYAMIHEFGDEGRDFLRVAMDSNLSKITQRVEQEYRQVILQKISVDEARKNIGEFLVSLVRQMIQDKGLVDTGRLLNSVEARNA